jgi:TolB protein
VASIQKSMGRFRLVLILALVTGLMVIGPSSPVRATFPGTNGKIAFDDYVGSEHIFTVNPDGSDATDLTPGMEAANPAWSPDGTKIVFEEFTQVPGGIWVMDVDGSNKVQLTSEGGSEPSYSPDGTRIVYVMSDGLVLMLADGTHKKKIVHQIAPSDPEFSPDGMTIAYVKIGDIWLVPRNGKQPHAITNDGGASHPSWSPDGTRIAFHRYGSGQHSEDVWIMNADGTNQVNVTAGVTDGQLFRDPAWSPDGTQLAVRRSPDCYGGGLITINIDGTGETSVFCLYDAQNNAWQSLP